MTEARREHEKEEGFSIIGYEEDGVVWVTAPSDLIDARDAERELDDWSGTWRAVEDVFVSPELSPGGQPYGGGDENWSEGRREDPYSRRAWQLVDVSRRVIVIDGEEQANAHYDLEGSNDTGGLTEDRRRRSPIIEALRTAGDEFQFTRVLAAVCSSAPETAHAFVHAVLRAAALDAEIGERAKRLRLPSSISCTREHGLARVGRRTIAKQKRTLGTPDLTFTADDPGFRLICELKINAKYRPDQIKDYLRSGAYVVGIVRKPTTLPEPVLADDHWLGEIKWQELKDELRQLPLADLDQQVWLDLLDVMEGDGDFEPTVPTRATEDDRRLVEAVMGNVLPMLQRAVRKRPAGATLAEGLHVGTVGLGPREAWAEVEDATGVVLFALRARNARLRTPSIAVEWYPPPGRRAERQQRDLRKRLDEHDFRPRSGGGGYFRFRRDLTIGKGGQVDVATATAWRAVEAVVSLGLVDQDIRDVARG